MAFCIHYSPISNQGSLRLEIKNFPALNILMLVKIHSNSRSTALIPRLCKTQSLPLELKENLLTPQQYRGYDTQLTHSDSIPTEGSSVIRPSASSLHCVHKVLFFVVVFNSNTSQAFPMKKPFSVN